MAEKPVILLTGFSSFPGAPLNPTKVTLQSMRHSEMEMPASVVFPVSYQIVDKYLDRILDAVSPDIVISLGLSYEANGFTLESQAYNETDQLSVDIHDTIPDSMIAENATEKLSSSVPLDKLYNHLASRNIPVSRSTDPGRYLCNYLYYKVMDKYKDDQSKWSCFIHVPLLDIQLDEIKDLYPHQNINQSLPSKVLVEGINLIVNFLNHEWGKIYS